MRSQFLLAIALWLPTALCAQVDGERKPVPVISSSKNTEFAPTISADGRLMIFQSDADKRKGWQLFESHFQDTVWTTPVPIRVINEKCQFLAGPSLSYDGNTLYYTAFIEGITETEDIFYSERTSDGNWSEPRSLGAPINTTDGYEGFPSISADGNSMYFMRVNEANEYDKKNRENCFTIFVSKLTPAGKWAEPVPVPAPINGGCERDPKIMADNHTLIFSSIRDGGKGKFDLFQSRLLPDQAWSTPVALDFINAEDNDQSPCISASGDVMYFYSLKDIYAVTIPEQFRQLINVTVKGVVRSSGTQAPLKTHIHVRADDLSEEFSHESSPIDGQYTLVLSAGKKYTVEFESPDHLLEVLTLDYSSTDRYLEVSKDVTLHSDYTVQLTVQDKDLGSPMKAWLNVAGQGQVFRDTVLIEQYPIRLTLPAGKDFTMSAAAKRFPLQSMPWKFDIKTFRPDMTASIPLVHEKAIYKAEVTNIISNQKSKVKVYFNNENVDEVVIAESGTTAELRRGDRYQVMTSSEKGFFFSTATIVAGDGESDGQGGYVIHLIIVPIEVGAQLTLNHITFASNSTDLAHTSFLELDRVIEFLQKNPTVQIEISAHTDDVGDSGYNQKLSARRAQSAVAYLLEKGVDKKKLVAKGFGKHKPLVPNDSDENRAKNRRVELRILKIG